MLAADFNGDLSTAYQFKLDGLPMSLPIKDYQIVFEPVRETVTCGVTFDKGRIWSGMTGPDNRKAKITLETVNGEPDWTTAKVEAAR